MNGSMTLMSSFAKAAQALAREAQSRNLKLNSRSRRSSYDTGSARQWQKTFRRSHYEASRPRMLVRSRDMSFGVSTMSSKRSGVCGGPSETKSAPGNWTRSRDINGSSPTLVLSTSTTSTGSEAAGSDEGDPVRPERRLVDGRERGGAGLEVHADLVEAHRLGGNRHPDGARRRLGLDQGQHAAGGGDQAAGDQRAQALPLSPGPGRSRSGPSADRASSPSRRRRPARRSRRRGCCRRGRSGAWRSAASRPSMT